MKPEQIFIGNIKQCTKYEMHKILSSSFYIGNQCIGCDTFGHIDMDDELYKKDAILIKLKHGGYVDVENINSILDHIKIRRYITKDGFRLGGLIISTKAHYINSLLVDEDSLKPYYDNNQRKNISVRQLKKQIKNNI